MFPSKLGLTLIGLSLAPLGVLGFTFGNSALDHSTVEEGARITEGQRRLKILKTLTKDYIAQGSDVTKAMRSGEQLAPIAFLNEALKRKRTIFRVRSTDGMSAKTFLVTP